MPTKPLSRCAFPGCKKVSKNRYCDEHNKQIHSEYKDSRTDIEEQKFYGSGQWKKIRKLVMLRDNSMCQECKRRGEVSSAQMVDHIIEIKDGGCKTCYDNLESLCYSCHEKKTKRVASGR